MVRRDFGGSEALKFNVFDVSIEGTRVLIVAPIARELPIQ